MFYKKYYICEVLPHPTGGATHFELEDFDARVQPFNFIIFGKTL